MTSTSKKRATLADVASLAGVCRSAVGKVLNGTGGSIRVGAEARERIKHAARVLKYRPNMAGTVLAGGDSRLIGVLLDSCWNYSNLRLLSELESLCAERSCQLLTCYSHDSAKNMERNYSMLLRYGVKGVICCAHDYPGMEEEIRSLFEDGENLVFMEKPSFAASCYVATTRRKAFGEMIRFALEKGYKRIGAVHGALEWASERKLHREFSLALQDCSLPVDGSMIYTYVEKDSMEERCKGAVRELIKPQKVDFLFVHDAPSAVFLQNLIREEDLSVTLYGGDDDPLFKGILPTASSLHPPYRKIAQMLFESACGEGQKGPRIAETMFQ